MQGGIAKISPEKKVGEIAPCPAKPDPTIRRAKLGGKFSRVFRDFSGNFRVFWENFGDFSEFLGEFSALMIYNWI